MNDKAEVLQERLIKFAADVIKVARMITKDKIGDYLASQLYRSGTSPALNYAEARSAESRADFIHKMKISLKELRETQVCLKLINRTMNIDNEKVLPVIEESSQLIAIFVSSVQTAKNTSLKLKVGTDSKPQSEIEN